MNGTRHDIPNTNHLGEKRRKEGKGFKRVHNQKREAKLLNLLSTVVWLNHMLASMSLLLMPGESCPSSMHPRSMCVHAKAETRNRQTSNGRKRCKEYMNIVRNPVVPNGD